jgi:AraC family transcriptional regulator of arabinose operon
LHESVDSLLQSAELSIVQFDIQTRNELQTFNRILPCYVMSYLKKGEAKLRIGNEVFNITPGTVVIIPPNVEHDHFKEIENETIFLWCHFTYEVGNTIDVMKIFNFPISFKLQNSETFERVFLEFKELTTSEDFLIKTVLKKAKSYEILYLLLENIMSSQEEDYEQDQSKGFLCILTQIVKYPEKDISLQELSEQFHMHPTYISNRFKEIFGKPPIQVQRELKIDRAKKLLGSTDLTITEIANAVGFSSVPGFTRLFKNYVGISPSKFRNLNTKWNDKISVI